MNMRRELRTDRRLWVMFAVLVFVLLGFVRLHTPEIDQKGGPSYFWGFVAAGQRLWKWWEFPCIIANWAAILVVPSAALGWVAQAIVVAIQGKPAPTTALPPN